MNCGADLTEPLQLLASYEDHSPAIKLMPYGGLGTDLPHIRFANKRAVVLGKLVGNDFIVLEYAKKLIQMLPHDEKVADIAGKMLEKEFELFPSLYLGLNVTTKIADAVVKSVYNRLVRAGLVKN